MSTRLMGSAAALAAVLAFCIALAAAPAPTTPQNTDRVDFARDVQPILRQHCYECHGPEKQKNGFRLDRRRDAMRGGTIAMIGRGNSEGSRLYHRLIGDTYGRQMPPDGPLPASQIAILKKWIDQGAEWPDALSGETPLPPPDAAATELMNALRAGERSRVSRLLATHRGAINKRGPAGATPLMHAVLYGDAAAVRQLLDAGADPNIADFGGATPLMLAVTDREKTTLLLERGANVNARSAIGRTALLIASGVPGAAPVVEMLLDRGASPSEKAQALLGEVTPLVLAAYSGDEATFRLLVARGADVKAAGPAALGLSFRAQCKGCIDTMLQHVDAEALTGTMVGGSPPFGPALATAMLIERGADMKARDRDGRTMLMLAAASAAPTADVVKFLIARGADVNARTPAGHTALGYAKRHGDTPVVKALLDAGANDEPLPPAPSSVAPAASPRAAIARSLPLLQKSDVQFMEKSGCVSCHNNTLTAMSVAAARARGIRVDESTARKQVRAIGTYLESWRERVLQGVGIPGDVDTVSYILLGLAAEKHPADAATDAMARFLRGQQRPEGHWLPLALRPPIEGSVITATALTLRALQLYAPQANRAGYDASIERGAKWLTAATPHDIEDHAFHLLGLKWAGAPRPSLEAAARALIARQRADGGWAQIPSLSSDAYASGQALFALAESGVVAAGDPAVTRGVQYLLNTQLADGSWFVRTRAIPLQPHFEAGFPHGRDQFISAAATNWATLALTHALAKPRS